MKPINLNILKFSFLTALLVLLAFAGCKEKEIIIPPSANLEALIAEAEDLIATGVEGTSPGDLKPGTIAQLQDVLTWVEWQIENADENSDITNAALRLQKYIDIFKTSIVELAIPIFNNTSGSWIQISENIKPLLADNFTIEIEAYYLGPGWIETIFAAGEGDDGGPFGFNIRSFGNRFDLVIGAGANGWKETYVPDGAGLKLGEWAHYAVTKSGPVWKVYLDGAEIISLSDGPTETIFKASVPFTLGETPFWPGRAYNGLLRDFRVWSEVRTADQLIANKDEDLEGTEAGLEVYFPLDADLGTEFKDKTGNYTATFKGSGVVWAPGGIPPVIELDFTSLDLAIAQTQAFVGSVVEGENDGDYPIGTIDYLQSLIDDAIALKDEAEKQDQLDNAVSKLQNSIELVESNLVADATGIYVNRENPNAVGLRITPNYTPQGDYTVEFDLKIKTLFMESGDNGEIFGNGSFGLRIYGYNEISEQAILNSGGLWNFTNANNAWEGPHAPPLTIKSQVWQHVAIVHDETARTTTIFVDGEEVGMQSDFGFPLESDWGEIWLGNSWGGKMNGTIKDFRIWDAVKTPAELNAEIDGTESDLQIYFPLDRVAGVMFKDVTGNYDAELRGVVWEK